MTSTLNSKIFAEMKNTLKSKNKFKIASTSKDLLKILNIQNHLISFYSNKNKQKSVLRKMLKSNKYTSTEKNYLKKNLNNLTNNNEYRLSRYQIKRILNIMK